MGEHINRRWVGPKLWYLLNLPSKERYELFCEHLGYNKETIKAKRKLYLKKIRKGTEVPPRRPRNYEEGEPMRDVADRLNAAPVLGEMAVSQIIDQETRDALHKKLDDVLDEANINPEAIKSFKVSSWDMGYKDSDGEARSHRLNGIQLIAEPREFEAKWDIVKNIECDPLPFNNERKFKAGEMRREVILPDMQIGFRRYEDGTLDPFHDEKAIDIALQILDEVKPSRIIMVGDFLDLPNFSRYEQTPEFAQTTNASLEYGHKLLKTIRTMLPEASIIYLAGNHEARLTASIRKNLIEAYGIRRPDETIPLFSIPSLLALDKLGVEYVEGYPAGRYYINPNLMVIHGTQTKKGGAAKANNMNETASTITGHSHRIESAARTVRTHEGARITFSYTCGTLSRIDGAVPSYHSATDLHGRPLTNHEDWQQGLGVLSHDGKTHAYSQIFIDTLNGHKTYFEGKVYQPLVKKPRKRK